MAGVARDLALTARTIGGAEAQRVNLVSGLFPDAQQLHAEAEKLVKQLAAKSPLAMTGTKRVLLYQRCGGVPIFWLGFDLRWSVWAGEEGGGEGGREPEGGETHTHTHTERERERERERVQPP